MKKILMHTCCAPCSTYVIKKLREEGFEDITSYWYNPNIQPYDEYKHRLETLKEYTQMVNVPLIIQDYYDLKEFLQNVINYDGIRCEYCYRIRLEMSVKYAKENGYDCFTTTLLVSPYQKHDLLKKVCEELSREYDIEFVYYDFREGYHEGQQMAKDAGLYRQKYCGCVFSRDEAEFQRDAFKKQEEERHRINREEQEKNKIKKQKNNNKE